MSKATIKPNKAARDFSKKLKNLPKLKDDRLISQTLKKHAEGVRRSILEVVKTGKARPGLNPLSARVKAAEGGTVNEPLFGSGSMLTGLVVVKNRRTWSLRIQGRHKSGLSQKAILSIHEHGASIRITPKMRKAFAMLLKKHGLGDNRKQPSRKRVIRIPARRPFRRGFNAYLRSEAKKQTDVELRKAIRAGIRRLK